MMTARLCRPGRGGDSDEEGTVTREGILVERPVERLKGQQIERIHRASMDILEDSGLISYNRQAADIFGSSGARVWPSFCWRGSVRRIIHVSGGDASLRPDRD